MMNFLLITMIMKTIKMKSSLMKNSMMILQNMKFIIKKPVIKLKNMN